MIKFPYEPTGTNIIFQKFEEAEMIGKIIIPRSAQKKLNQGRVLKVGPDCIQKIKPGAIILFALHMDSAITIDQIDFGVIEECNIYAYGDEKKVLDNSKEK